MKTDYLSLLLARQRAATALWDCTDEQRPACWQAFREADRRLREAQL